MNRKVVTLALTISVLVLATYYFVNGYYTSVVIDDVAVRHGGNARYRIIDVDGNMPNRIKSFIITMVPFVIASPGVHEVRVERVTHTETGTVSDVQEVKMMFDSYSRYDLDIVNGKVGFVRR